MKSADDGVQDRVRQPAGEILGPLRERDLNEIPVSRRPAEHGVREEGELRLLRAPVPCRRPVVERLETQLQLRAAAERPRATREFLHHGDRGSTQKDPEGRQPGVIPPLVADRLEDGGELGAVPEEIRNLVDDEGSMTGTDQRPRHHPRRLLPFGELDPEVR